MKADIDLDIGRKTFDSGLLPELIAVLHRSRPGDLVAVVGDEESVGPELETWCRFTGGEVSQQRRLHAWRHLGTLRRQRQPRRAVCLPPRRAQRSRASSAQRGQATK